MNAQDLIPMTRVFSTPGVHPYDQVEWERRDVVITDDGGRVIFEQTGIECPKSLSPLATKIVVATYFWGDIARGTDPFTGVRENSAKQLIPQFKVKERFQ